MSILPFFANFFINLLNDFVENYQNLIFSCKLTTLFTPKWFLFLLRPDKNFKIFCSKSFNFQTQKRWYIFSWKGEHRKRKRERDRETKIGKFFFTGNEIFLSFHFSYWNSDSPPPPCHMSVLDDWLWRKLEGPTPTCTRHTPPCGPGTLPPLFHTRV